MKVGEIRCKSILGRSGISGVDYAVNPYLGCSHACAYCYARFMRRMGHPGEPWGSFVDAKVNAAERLRVEAAKAPRGRVLFSSVTDAYQPLEKERKLTRSCLEILLDQGYSVDILTKSSLVLRDHDAITRFDDAQVGLTVTTLDDRVRAAFEPGASPIAERLEALKAFTDSGVPTYAFIGPLHPYLSEEKIDELLDALADRVSHVLIDRLNVKCGNLPDIRKVLDASYPEIKALYLRALEPGSGYYPQLKHRLAAELERRSIPSKILF